MRAVACLWPLLLVMAALAADGSREHNPVRLTTRDPQATGRIIIKLRVDAAPQAPLRGVSRLQRILTRARADLGDPVPIAGRLQVMRLRTGAMEATLERLRADPEVEYAEPEERRYIHALPGLQPDDPLYRSLQWYLQPPGPGAPAAIDAQSAWGIGTGSTQLVIADLDTGVRYDHPDLRDVASGGRLLPGYCFISDPFVSNGGSCLGPAVSMEESSDPGDWITEADLTQSQCSHASAGGSSWHGTRTASLLGELTNNAQGLAGVTWQAQILPVRVLGKCGGADADIARAMLWAGGIPVAGAPPNLTPAKVINMSLGGRGACPQVYRDVIAQLAARGVLVVASVGNSGGEVETPANCPGVVGVAGLRHSGTKVDYSNLGPEVSLSAPSGDCVNSLLSDGTPCLYPITSATNAGTSTPEPYGTAQPYSTQIPGAYTDQVNAPNIGTSFASPLVAGIGALMSSVNPHLNSCQLSARLRGSATPFPPASGASSLPICQAPGDGTPVPAECQCTSSTCGAGMANAPAAVQAALRPVANIETPPPYSPGQTLRLQGGGSAAASGTLVAYAWSQVGGEPLALQGVSSPVLTLSAPTCGLALVRLTVTDSAGATDSTEVVITPGSATVLPPGAPGADGSCVAAAQLGVCPALASVPVGAGRASFIADVAGADREVSWQVNGVPGGNAALGTITSTGVYTPPASLPSSTAVTVTAVLRADPTLSSSAHVTLTAPSGGGGALGGSTLGVGVLLLAWKLWRARR